MSETFCCAECEREVRTDNEVVICRCSDEPTCDPCCEAYHREARGVRPRDRRARFVATGGDGR